LLTPLRATIGCLYLLKEKIGFRASFSLRSQGKLLILQEVSEMKVRPLHDRVLVKRTEEEEKTKGGIIIPDTAKEKPIRGKVIAVGKGKLNDDGKVIPLEVKEGDSVLFGKYAGTEVKIDDEEHLIMREDDILAIIS
jgi:chaperonin GroES